MIVAYPQPRKQKSVQLLNAFVRGAGAGIVNLNNKFIPEYDAAFYGTVGIEPLFNEAVASGRNWYYLDNAYFDSLRERYFRVGKNSLQTYRTLPDYDRLKAMGVEVAPWQRERGSEVIVIEQSDYFMSQIAHWPGGLVAWRVSVVQRLKQLTQRQIVVRHWNRDKTQAAREWKDELKRAWVVVVHSSAAAVTAILNGIPAIVTDHKSAMWSVSGSLTADHHNNPVDEPFMPNGREEWAASLAALQWTPEEMAQGKAWDTLQRC